MWKSDTLESIDFYNDWFLRFAPTTYREQRKLKTAEVAEALKVSDNLRALSPSFLMENPGILPMLRMAAAPPLARDRLVGLSYTTKNLLSCMEGVDGKIPRIPPRMENSEIESHLARIVDVLSEVMDRDLFPWLDNMAEQPSEQEIFRSSSVVADRLCGAAADPIIRNAQEKRQLQAIGSFLQARGYEEISYAKFRDLMAMPLGTYAFRYTVTVRMEKSQVNLPLDCVISKHHRQPGELPILIEAKSAGDATNTNKRRKEEAQKYTQLKQAYGKNIPFVLFLCGYFEASYLGYEAAEGIDWVWEHRISDLAIYLDEIEPVRADDCLRESPPPYTSSFLDIEAERLRRQKQIDASKTALQRNQLGQFSTPFPLASKISRYALGFFPNDRPLKVLEPACGSGVFVSSLISLRKDGIAFQCVDIDRAYGSICESLFADFNVSYFHDDFFALVAEDGMLQKCNLLVTNPPYVRHHHIGYECKRELQVKTYEQLGIAASGLSGLYIYYILLADKILADGAIASWLIPSEFLYTNYGKALREYLLGKVTLLRLHSFDAAEVQFDDALVSSCVVTYRKERPSPTHAFEVSQGDYQSPESTRVVLVDAVSADAKWNFFHSGEASATGGILLGDLFHVTRGVATGNNDFFILKKDDAENLKIESQALVPLMPSPREISGSIVEADCDGFPSVGRRKYLLVVGLPPDAAKDRFPNAFSYLENGLREGAGEGYLCQSRKVWYYQEKREPPLYLTTYMGRKGSNGKGAIRFLLNRTAAVATNVYICLYPNTLLRNLLAEDPAREVELLDALNAISSESLLEAGRKYGGGLQKIEPKELRSLRLANSPPWLRLKRKPEQLSLFVN